MFHYRHPLSITLLFSAMTGVGFMTAAHAEKPDPLPPSIHVNGIGRVSIAPDKADVSLSIEVQAKTAESARTQAASAMTALIKAVKATGVADKDIQTRYVSLYPIYAPDTANKITGYQLSNQVTVCVRDIAKISSIMDTAVNAGGNFTRIQGISFAIDNPDAALSEARDIAYKNARIKAEQYAKLANVTLGKAIYINEGGLPPVPVPYTEMSAMKSAMVSDSTPVQAGEQEVSVTVDVVFGVE